MPNTPVAKQSVLHRWSRLMAKAIYAEVDLRTVKMWAKRSNMGTSTLRGVCRIAGLPSKRSLDLARVIRAVLRLQGHPWMPEAILDCRDPRTMRRLLTRTGGADHEQTPTLDDFFGQQTILPADGARLAALRQAVIAFSIENTNENSIDKSIDPCIDSSRFIPNNVHNKGAGGRKETAPSFTLKNVKSTEEVN